MGEIIDRLGIGVLVLDQRGRVLKANRFCIEKGLVADNPEGSRYYEALRSFGFITLVNDFLEGRLKEGRFEHGGSVYEVLFHGNGDVVVEVREVSDIVRLREAQREFVAGIVHELATPITAVRGLLETAMLSENRKEVIGRALSRVKEMERLINTMKVLLSDAVQHRAGEGSTPLRPVVEKILEDLKGEVEDKKVRVFVSIEDSIEVPCDEEKVYVILKNIIENAVKYNREGGKVEIEARASEGRVELTVRDEGLGIPPAELPLIFEPFFGGRNKKGLGLGLTLSKKFADLCGAKIEVQSREGTGTTVKVVFQSSNL